MKKLFFVLMAIAAITMTVCIGCEKKPINDPETPENLIPPKDTDGANQNRWGLAPERIPLTVTYTENDEE